MQRTILPALSLILLSLLGLLACHSNRKLSSKMDKPNVLFIAIDDLRPELGCYGNPVVRTPNLDKLAQSGFLFNNHFVTVPTCGASRYSLLTGALPRLQDHVSNDAIAKYLARQPETPRPESFVHHLRRNGYYTVGMGKISHSADGLVYGYLDEPSDVKEMPHSWDEFLFDAGKWQNGWNAFFAYADGSDRNHKQRQVKPYEAGDVGDNGYPDGLTAELAIKKLGELKQRDQPFFMGVGFFKPHLPFTAPKKYWDLYREEDIPLSASPGIPENVDRASLHPSGEFNQYALGEEKAGLDHDLSPAYARKLRHAYYACISYIDAQVGKVLAELERQGLADNTIVVIWGDHGWHLGDQRVWGKHTIFERGVKSAFILKVPGRQISPAAYDEVVSTVDIFPTLVDLCGLEMPFATDGNSLTKLWKKGNPETTWRNTAFSYFRNGISLRTPRYRLTKYFRDAQPVVELYDHQIDPLETKNVAAEQPAVVEQLWTEWNKGNTGIFQQKNDPGGN